MEKVQSIYKFEKEYIDKTRPYTITSEYTKAKIILTINYSEENYSIKIDGHKPSIITQNDYAYVQALNELFFEAIRFAGIKLGWIQS